MRLSVIIGVGVVLSFAAPAWATTGTCASAPDGTPCVDECIDAGHCDSGACVADHVSADGTACSTGNFCTLGDTCHAGACVAGTTQRTCPSAPDGCHVSSCNPTVGCEITLICLDAGAPPDLESAPADLAQTASADLAQAPADLAQAPAGDDLALAPAPADLALAPDSGSVTTSPSPDMALPAADDMGVADGGEPTGPSAPVGTVAPPDMSLVTGTPVNATSPYVHGSAVGCSATGSDATPDLALVAVLLLTLLAPLRRRLLATRQ
ncbi:MAG TPA: hypothetical protein VIA18_31085 [Polyangia bacterium]|nr:hypothetical protein [Polyangia bacterium]